MTEYYLAIRWLHIAAVILSGSLFLLRGSLVLAGHSRLAMGALPRYLSIGIDSVLLAAAITLTFILQQYPLLTGWLSAKVVLLIAYIVLGSFALKRGRSLSAKAGFFVAALAVYLFIVSIALTHHPLGIFHSIMN
jgi:uncharacterized membrane protein SirB2